MSPLSFKKASNGINTCHTSARDQKILMDSPSPESNPAPTKHPIYAASTPQPLNHSANGIINATAIYMVEKPGVDGKIEIWAMDMLIRLMTMKISTYIPGYLLALELFSMLCTENIY